MGGHYGSVQIRSDDRVAVKAVAEQVANALKVRLLIGPAIDGWIGVYPENNGQDEKVSQQVAQLTDGYVLHLLVHDDDIFAYWLYHDRHLIDSYWSAPGYFGDQNRASEEKMVGNPELFRPLIEDRVSGLRALLARDKSKLAFESERLGEFAKLLRISNAVQAYEYLKEEDHGYVKGWRQFEEIPAARIDLERTNARRERTQVNAAMKKFQSDGLLLLRDQRKEQIAYGCCSSDGFLVAWPDHVKHTVDFSLYHEPWKLAQSIVLETPAHVTALATDAGAKTTAIAAGDRVQIWDSLSSQPKHVVDILEADLAISVSISADGKRVVHVSRGEIVVSDSTDGKRLFALPTQSHRIAAFHPSGEWIAMAGNTLGLISVNGDPHWRDLFIGGPSVLAARFQQNFRSGMKSVDLNDLDKQQRAAMKKVEQTMRKMAGRLKSEEFSEGNLARAREATEKMMGEFRGRLVALKEGRLPPDPPQANEPVLSVGFSQDGRLIFCSTNSGLRVYEWSTVPRTSGANMPSPVWRYNIPRDASVYVPGHIHAMAEEVDASAIIFACGSKINRMDLSSGETRELLQVPGSPTIYQLQVSLDGTKLGIASRDLTLSATDRSRRAAKQYWDVWSLPRLRGPFMQAGN
jgi:hypothetical protein